MTDFKTKVIDEIRKTAKSVLKSTLTDTDKRHVLKSLLMVDASAAHVNTLNTDESKYFTESKSAVDELGAVAKALHCMKYTSPLQEHVHCLYEDIVEILMTSTKRVSESSEELDLDNENVINGLFGYSSNNKCPSEIPPDVYSKLRDILQARMISHHHMEGRHHGVAVKVMNLITNLAMFDLKPPDDPLSCNDRSDDVKRSFGFIYGTLMKIVMHITNDTPHDHVASSPPIDEVEPAVPTEEKKNEHCAPSNNGLVDTLIHEFCNRC